MKVLVRLLYLLILLVIVVAGMLFTFRNTVAVPLDLFFLQLPPTSISVWILVAFTSGGLFGVLFTLGVALRLKTGNVILSRRLGKAKSTPASGEPQAE